jgi:LPS export ABC transporter protein LptC
VSFDVMNRASSNLRGRSSPGDHGLRMGTVSLLTGALLALAAAGCGRQRPAEPSQPAGELPDQEVSDFVLTETDDGMPQWKLYARYAATYNSRNVIVAHAVRVDFFDERGAESSELTAREGDIKLQSRDMTARGDVVLQTHEGTRMSAQEVRFLNREQRIVSPEDQMVRVERTGDVLTGYGFESDPGLKHFEFKHRVQAVVHTRSGGGLVERGGTTPARAPARPGGEKPAPAGGK